MNPTEVVELKLYAVVIRLYAWGHGKVLWISRSRVWIQRDTLSYIDFRSYSVPESVRIPCVLQDDSVDEKRRMLIRLLYVMLLMMQDVIMQCM
jgi:hypothetical protein